MTTKLKIEGMHCASCKHLIEDVCKETVGVASCDVDIDKNIATIEHDADTDISKLRAEIEGLGAYHVSVI